MIVKAGTPEEFHHYIQTEPLSGTDNELMRIASMVEPLHGMYNEYARIASIGGTAPRFA